MSTKKSSVDTGAKNTNTGDKNYEMINRKAAKLGKHLDTAKQVAMYSQWLETDADALTSNQSNATEYADDALRPVTIRGQQINSFAPYRHHLSAFHTITMSQILVFCGLALALVLGIVFYGMPMLVGALAVIITLYLGDLLFTFLLSVQILNESSEEDIRDKVVHALADADWPAYTILCPLYKEVEVVPQFVKAMQDLDYPVDKLQILFLTEEDDTETRNAIAAMNLAAHFSIIIVPDGTPRTKPRACNFGLLQATGDYIVIYDAEDVPDPLQLKKAVLTFVKQGPDVACVQAKLNFYNSNQNLLTRWFTAEYSLWFDLTLPGLQRAGLPLPLGGTSNHFRAETLRTLGAWDPFNVTEDCDLGQRLAHYQLRTAVLNSTTYEEANSQYKNWLRQRSRWIKGYMQTYLVYMRKPWQYLQPGRMREFLALQLIIGGKTAVLFVNPLMWLMVIIYLLFRPIVGPTYEVLFPRAILYMGSVCLLLGNFFYIYSHLTGCLKRRQYGLIKWTLLIPIYWAMTSIAAFIALEQLIFKPHYWEKTKHGLHLNKAAAQSPGIQSALVSQQLSIQDEASLRVVSQALSTRSMAQTQASTMNDDVTTKLTPRIQAPASALNDDATVKLPPRIQAPAPALNGDAAVKLPPEVQAPKSTMINDSTIKITALPKFPDTSGVDVETVATVTMPAIVPSTVKIRKQTETEKYIASLIQTKTQRSWWSKLFSDPWLIATFIVSCIAGISALYYFFQQHEIIIYGDALSHMLIARRIFDNSTPGFAQLGGVWVPLPHLMMLPLIWNDYLWHTGLAGSLSSLPCYLVASIYIYLSARRLTKNGLASFIGTLVFILNPNVLYLQTTPLTEPVLIAALSMACFHFLAWSQDDHPKHLILAAAGTFLATLSRFDGWALFAAFLVFIVLVGLIKRHRWAQIEGNLIIFGALGCFGILLWNLWCDMIFGDPLYWQRGPFSSQAQQMALVKAGILYTYHNAWQSLRFFTLDSISNVGLITFVLGVFALIVFVARRRIAIDTVAVLSFWIPFAFYVVALYSGQAAIFIPSAVPAHAPFTLYNARYGVEVVAPCAVMIATLISAIRLVRPANFALRIPPAVPNFIVGCLFVGAIAGQALLTVQGGIISLQDGQFGLDCSPTHPIVAYMAQHYNGGRILEDVYSSKMDSLEPEANIHFVNFIYEGSGPQWQQALANPASKVDWIIANPTDSNDLIPKHIALNSPDFLRQFKLIVQEPHGLHLYYRNGLPPLPSHAFDTTILTMHARCGAKNN